jgi:ATP-dependent Clp protease ATP-binding subunit ClpA
MPEFTEYTFGLRKIFRQAMEAARRRGHLGVMPEHYLLAIVSSRRGMATQLLADMGVNTDALQGATEAAIPADPPATAFKPQPGRCARRVLRIAREVADEMGTGFVGTEHLFLALMHDGFRTARLLRDQGATFRLASDALCRSYDFITQFNKKRSAGRRDKKDPPKKARE